MDYNINWIAQIVDLFDIDYKKDYFGEEEAVQCMEFIMCNEKISNDFDWNYGATKLVIEPYKTDYVYKIPFNCTYDCFEESYIDLCIVEEDYCKRELDIYALAENEGFEDFFLPMKYIGTYKNFPIYVQKKAEVFNYQRYYSQNSASIVTSKTEEQRSFLRLPFEWRASCLDAFYENFNELTHFIDFLESTTDIISDLHDSNIGFYNQKPVIFDYAGFYEG